MRVPTVSLRHEEEIIVAGSSRKTSWFIYFYISVYIFSMFTTASNYFIFLGWGAHHICWLVKILLYLGVFAQPMCITGDGGILLRIYIYSESFAWTRIYVIFRGSNEVPTRVGGAFPLTGGFVPLWICFMHLMMRNQFFGKLLSPGFAAIWHVCNALVKTHTNI